jgi:hypothetical protein
MNMKFETKFNIGDVVCKITMEHDQKWIPCKFCLEKGYIHGGDGSTLPCPMCWERKGETKFLAKKWQVHLETLTIGQIRVAYTGASEGVSDLFGNYGPQKEKYEEIYMCLETGIGSGTLHNADTLFANREEAIAACDRLNEEETKKGE